jgi:hypothetical protein
MVAHSHSATRIAGSMAGAPGHRLDARVQRRQVQRLHERPHGARRVVGREQRFQIDRAQFDLVALGRHHPRGITGLRTLSHHRTCRQLPLTEQTCLDLFTLVSCRRSTHALLNGSGARFVHKF